MALKIMKELRALSVAELETKAREISKEVFETKMSKVTGQLKDNAKIWRLRKQMARVQTLLTQKQGGKS